MRAQQNQNNLNLILVVGVLSVLGCVCPPPDVNRNTSSASSSPSPISNSTGPKGSNNANTAKAFDYERNGLELISSKWHKGGFNTVAIWKVTIKNVSDKSLGDIKFSTEYYSETKNVVSKGGTKGILGKDTIEKIVPPKSTRTFEVNDGFVGDEAVTADFQLESWRIIDK